MGGFGSGRWGWHAKKRTAEACWAVRLDALFRGRPPAVGPLGGVACERHGRPDGDVRAAVVPFGAGLALKLNYAVRGAGPAAPPVDLTVPLVRRPAPRGGGRWVGICPLACRGVACGRTAALLYLPPGATYFGCRRCHRLTYRSSQTHDPRVARMLKNPAALLGRAGDFGGHSVAQLGVLLSALTEFQRRLDRDAARLDRRFARDDPR